MDKKLEMNRRSLLKGSAAAATIATVGADQLLNYATAWAQTAPLKPEARCAHQRAALAPLRRSRRQGLHGDGGRVPEGDRLSRYRLERIRSTTFSRRHRLPRTPARVSTWCGVFIRCRIFSPRSASIWRDVANYLGKKYGGWTPIGRSFMARRRASGSACRLQPPAA